MWLLCQTDLQVGKSVYYLVPVVGHPTSQQSALGKSRIPDIGNDHTSLGICLGRQIYRYVDTVTINNNRSLNCRHRAFIYVRIVQATLTTVDDQQPAARLPV